MRFRSGTWKTTPWGGVRGSRMDALVLPVITTKDSSMSSVAIFLIACPLIKSASWISISASGPKWRQCANSELMLAPWSSESTSMPSEASRHNTMARLEWALSSELTSQIRKPRGRCSSSPLIRSTLVKSLASTSLIWLITWERMLLLMTQQWFEARMVILKGLSCLLADGQSTPS